MREKLRYVTVRKGRTQNRYYWQRRGSRIIRLSDDPVKRYSQVLQLNARADRKEGTGLLDGSIGWVIQEYIKSDEYQCLASGTKKYYQQYMYDIQKLGKDLPFSVFDRKMVIDFVGTYSGGNKRKVAGVLKNLFNTATYLGAAHTNHARDLRLPGQKSRTEVWNDKFRQDWLNEAQRHGKADAMTAAFYLLENTAQRPGDVLRMTWTQYNGDTIKLRQQKTGKLAEVPCTQELRNFLDDLKRRSNHLLIVHHNDKPLKYTPFFVAFRDIANKASVPENLQPRDLRRTAMVNLALAGATDIEIAAISGHTIDKTRRILETYIPRNLDMAKNGIAKLELRKSLTR